jgi:hypothetical protein
MAPLHISCHLPFESDFVKVFNLPHTYGHCPEKDHLWHDNYQTLHMIHAFIPIIWNHNV